MPLAVLQRASVCGVVLLAWLAAGPTWGAAAAGCPAADEASVVTTLNRLYAAADAHDADGLRGVIATDFVAQEDGEKVDGERLIQRLASNDGTAPMAAEQPAGPDALTPAAEAAASARAAISHPEVHILCDSAWATFRAPSALHAGGERIESAVLNYQDDGWRVRFLNATVHQARTPAPATSRRHAAGKGHGTRGSAHPGGHRTGPARPGAAGSGRPAHATKARPARHPAARN